MMIMFEVFMKVFLYFVWSMDDLLVDLVVVLQYFLVKEVVKYVKVCLIGEGVDEFFGGYIIYYELELLKLFCYMKLINGVLKCIVFMMLEGMCGWLFLL